MFTYPIYNHNWRNISTIYIYITRLASKEIFTPSNKIHRKIGRAKDLSAPLYKLEEDTAVGAFTGRFTSHRLRFYVHGFIESSLYSRNYVYPA